MTRMRFSDFKAMYQSPFNDLYHALLGAGAKTEPGNVVIGLNVDRLKEAFQRRWQEFVDRKSTRLNSSHGYISYAVFCLKKKNHPAIARTYADHRSVCHAHRRSDHH